MEHQEKEETKLESYALGLIEYAEKDKGRISEDRFVDVMMGSSTNTKGVLDKEKTTVLPLTRFHQCSECGTYYEESLLAFGNINGVCRNYYSHPKVCPYCVKMFIGVLAQEQVNEVLSISENAKRRYETGKLTEEDERYLHRKRSKIKKDVGK